MNYFLITFIHILPALFDDLLKNSGDMMYTLTSMHRMWSIALEYTVRLFDVPDLPKLMEEEFDLLIYEAMIGDIYLGFAAHFKCPAVAVFSMESSKPLNSNLGNPTFDSFVPSSIVGFKGRMTFLQRTASFLGTQFMMFLAQVMMGDIYKAYE